MGAVVAEKRGMTLKILIEGRKIIVLYQIFVKSMRKSLLHIKELVVKYVFLIAWFSQNIFALSLPSKL